MGVSQERDLWPRCQRGLSEDVVLEPRSAGREGTGCGKVGWAGVGMIWAEDIASAKVLE